MCEHDLFVIGSRSRTVRKPTGERITYIIRRLRCKGCERCCYFVFLISSTRLFLSLPANSFCRKKRSPVSLRISF
ncbi:DUF6431 domain-containing protein [Tumebacillus permanentifrigoris]|uniref:DUF6431 domain-containing protein n=1 Tax=Tumebacillus permanentifrigoris TaxID=378543 RepID=UPI003CCC6569